MPSLIMMNPYVNPILIGFNICGNQHSQMEKMYRNPKNMVTRCVCDFNVQTCTETAHVLFGSFDDEPFNLHVFHRYGKPSPFKVFHKWGYPQMDGL